MVFRILVVILAIGMVPCIVGCGPKDPVDVKVNDQTPDSPAQQSRGKAGRTRPTESNQRRTQDRRR